MFLCKAGEDPGTSCEGGKKILPASVDLSRDLKSGKTSVKECKEALLMFSKGCMVDTGRPERNVYKKLNKIKSKEVQGCFLMNVEMLAY